MKKHKKLLSVVLAALMIGSAFSAFPVYAAETAQEQSVGAKIALTGKTENCSWSLNESTGVLTISGSGEMDLPSYFINADGRIKEIYIVSGITSISNYVFYGAYNLTKVTVPYTVETIGNYAFEFCDKLENLDLPQNGMSKLKTIRNGAFYGCSALKTVNFGDELKTIGSYAFTNSGLIYANIPESVTSIGSHALGFDYSNGVYTPVDSFVVYGVRGSAAESYVSKSNREDNAGFTFIGNNWSFNNITGVLHINGKGAMEIPGYWADKKIAPMDSVSRIIFDDRITTISRYSFYGFTGTSDFNGLFLPDGLTSIGEYAFEFAKNLGNVISLPENTKSIETGAFYSCNSLKKINLNDGLTTIGSNAFTNTALTSVTIPPSVTSIGDHAFGFDYSNRTYTKLGNFIIYGVRGSAAETYADKYGIRFVAQEYIKNINVSLDEPETGNEVNFEVTKDNPDCDFLTDYIVTNGTGLEFCYYKDDIATYMKPGERFQPDEHYVAYVWLMISEENTFFDTDVTVYINGKEANVTRYSSGLVCASYDFFTVNEYVPYDVNGNAYVDIGDATQIQYYLADMLREPFTEGQLRAADTNGNGVIDIGDATKIQYILADLIEG